MKRIWSDSVFWAIIAVLAAGLVSELMDQRASSLAKDFESENRAEPCAETPPAELGAPEKLPREQ